MMTMDTSYSVQKNEILQGRWVAAKLRRRARACMATRVLRGRRGVKAWVWYTQFAKGVQRGEGGTTGAAMCKHGEQRWRRGDCRCFMPVLCL